MDGHCSNTVSKGRLIFNNHGYLWHIFWRYSSMSINQLNLNYDADDFSILQMKKQLLKSTDFYCDEHNQPFMFIHDMDMYSAPLIKAASFVSLVNKHKGDVASFQWNPNHLKSKQGAYQLMIKPWYQDQLCNLAEIMVRPFPDEKICSFGIEIEAFLWVRDQLTSTDAEIIRNPHIFGHYYFDQTSIQEKVDIINRFIESIRAYFRIPKIKKKLADRRSNLNRNKKSCVQLIRSLIANFSKVLVVRVDLSMVRDPMTIKMRNKTLCELHSKDDLKALKDYVNKFLNNARHNKILNDIEGYILRFEYTVRAGFHAHAYFFFDGNKHQQDMSLGQYIKDYWKKLCGGQGSTFICNMQKHKYKDLAIGMLHHNDQQMLENLIKTFDYICKTDQYFMFTNMKAARSFQISRVVKKKSNAGRPRKHQPSTHSNS